MVLVAFFGVAIPRMEAAVAAAIFLPFLGAFFITFEGIDFFAVFFFTAFVAVFFFFAATCERYVLVDISAGFTQKGGGI